MKAKAKSAFTQPFLLVDSEVVRKIRQHARSCNDTEVCGVLIGQDKDLRIEVMACIEGENAEGAGAHVTFTQDTWEHIYAVKDKKYPNERIVGWYHSHPGFGIFLSEHDTFIHRNFFSSPGQVAWVFDPHSDEEGCFGWIEGRIKRLTRIAVLDRRGGEEAETRAELESEPAASAMQPVSVEPTRIRKNFPDPVQAFEPEEPSEGSSSTSLEELVAKVFFTLAVFALGAVLCWYFFPRVVIMPIAIDPISGKPLDPRDAQLLDELRAERNKADHVDSAKPGQPSASSADSNKGDHANPK